MNITIRDFMGLSSLDLQLDKPVTVLVGNNARGKTSVIRAVQGALTDGNPLVLQANKMKWYRYRVNNAARVELETSGKRQEWNVPGGLNASTPGIYASKAALDMASLTVPLTPAGLSHAWQGVLDLNPSEEFIKERLSFLLTDERDEFAAMVVNKGWEAALDVAKEKLRSFKILWENRVLKCDGAKVSWGPKRRTEWKPRDGHSCIGDSLVEINIKIDDARKRLSVAEAAEVVRQAKITSLPETEEQLENMERKRNEQTNKLKELEENRSNKIDAGEEMIMQHEKAIMKVEQDIKALPILGQCDICGKWHDGKRVLAGQDFLAINELQRDKLAGLENQVANMKQKRNNDKAAHVYELNSIDREIDNHKKALVIIEHEIEKLRETVAKAKAAIELGKDDVTHEAVPVSQVRHDLEILERKLEVVSAISDIEAINRQTDGTEKLVIALGHKGVRRDLLHARLNEIQVQIEIINREAGWGTVRIDHESLAVTFNKTPVVMCASSERKRADIALRLAIALTDGSELMLVDELNELDKNNIKIGLGLLVNGVKRSEGRLKVLVAITPVLDDHYSDCRLIKIE